MNWLTNFVKPKLRELVGGKREVPENLWHKCTSCGQMIFHRDLVKNLHVCQHCGHHMRIAARARLKMLFDEGAYETIELPKAPADPLKFKDLKRYGDRVKEAQTKTGEEEALVVAHGTMSDETGGGTVVVAVLNFDFLGGSMGIAVGEGLLAAAGLSVEKSAPLIVVTGSGGARMQEGILSLMQMARSTIAVEQVKEAGLPYIVVMGDPTTGGVSASFAMLGDVALAEPGALIGFAGQRVIEQTIREKLPEGFQRAEYLEEHGMIDMVVPRHQLRERLIRITGLLTRPAASSDVVPPEPVDEADDSAEAVDAAPVIELEAEAVEVLPPEPDDTTDTAEVGDEGVPPRA